MFGGFLNQSRHDNTDMNIGVDNFSKFHFSRMRKFLDGAPTQRSVLLGAVRSPAVFQNPGSQVFPTQLCGTVVNLELGNIVLGFVPIGLVV